MADTPLVGIIMGSQSDWTTMKHAADILDELGIAYEARIVSAHRTPDRMVEYAKTARSRGLKAIIAGAGGAAHLPGIPVGTLAIGVAGAKNAGLLAARVVALMDEKVAARLEAWHRALTDSVAAEPVDEA